MQQLEKKCYLIMSVLLLISVAAAAYGALALPENAQIPIHWNASFEADSWADKWPGLLMGPVLGLFLIACFWLTPHLEPRKAHIKHSQPVLALVLIAVHGVITLTFIGSILLTAGHQFPLTEMLGSSVAIMLILIGNFMGKIRSNFFLGIKTPWTLSDENVWNKTHRLAGKLFIFSGITILLSSIIQSSFSQWAILISIAAAVIIPIIYSWFIYQPRPSKPSTRN